MNRRHWQLRLLVLMGALTLVFASYLSAQEKPSGGKTTSGTSTPSSKTNTNAPAKPPAKSPPKPSTSRSASSRSTAGPAESIEGKWWTSGNDFGASEVIFSQNGSSVSGVIHYSDGRTGSLTGTMTESGCSTVGQTRVAKPAQAGLNSVGIISWAGPGTTRKYGTVPGPSCASKANGVSAAAAPACARSHTMRAARC